MSSAEADVETVNWVQIGLTLFGMSVVAALAWGAMQAQLKFALQKIAEVSDRFTTEIAKLTGVCRSDREQCEARSATRISEAKNSASEAHTRLDRHIDHHPGPAP